MLLDRILEEGMVLTVEPGCYFNPFLLKPALDDHKSAQFLIRDRIESLLVSGLPYTLLARQALVLRDYMQTQPLSRNACINWL